MRERTPRRIVCATGPGERLARGVVALLTGAFAVSMFPPGPIPAIAAAAVAAGVAFMAVTGWCPSTPTAFRAGHAETPDLPVPDARDIAGATAPITQETPQ
ncbi:YgaP-like transmembrane domain [Brachybacterium saurashtrense]|uniref:DUF2892 domain-containing protein n=1 Tax=Brachybacterium saurashtrense TaxID=556288 RepID=A0A345YLR1_9MICO|nr:YgaP-like transmembrane domain [Brachybacterium saurashtrense]AXK44863.1 DUF2892 domain-containing protein [Brachybacterium saurashtrense]RRR20728.1 DUF2892 domain-containing protein [Brachybacterium saurashtrense]